MRLARLPFRLVLFSHPTNIKSMAEERVQLKILVLFSLNGQKYSGVEM